MSELIKEFNQFLAQQQIFTAYQITPYIEQHPPHVTLYLANYQDTQIPKIIKHAENLAKQQKPVSLLTSQFIPRLGGYVMLAITNDSEIQGLSNKALNALSSLRNKKALIPAWAAQDVERQIIFTQYGSPNVLNYFNPHFSIFAAEHLHPDDSVRLHKQLQLLVSQFAKKHLTHVRASAYAIGVGIVDSQGQIVHELKSFNLE